MDNAIPKVEKRQLGSTGEKVSALGLGTYGINNYEEAETAFEYAFESGVNFLDTAEIYNTEDFVGRVIKKLGKENLFITTKISPDHLVSRDTVMKSARKSLDQLGIKTVDLILIHWPNDSMKIEDQVRNCEIAYSKGLTRYIGVSNFSVEQMEIARQSTNSAEIVCNQVEYNLGRREGRCSLLH